VFRVPLPAFVIGTLVGRGCLFLMEGLLGARYGAVAKQFLLTQKWASAAVLLGIVLIFVLIRRLSVLRQA
jgi:hypothetical protein